MDVTGAEENLEKFRKVIEPRGYKIFPVSAASNKGLKELIYYAAQKLKELPDTVLVNDQDNEVVYTAVEEEPFNIRKENGVFVVEGSWVQRLVRSVNFDNYESLQYFQRAIRRKGIVDALESMGINEGDTVRMYDLEFEYFR